MEEELKEKESKIVLLQETASVTTERVETLEVSAIAHEKEISSLKGQVEGRAKLAVK